MSATASRPKVRPLDPLDLDGLLSDEERLILTPCALRHGPGAAARRGLVRGGTLPRDIMPELGKLGVLGMHLTGYGCAGREGDAYGVACRELEAGDSGLRSSSRSRARCPCSRSGGTARKSRRAVAARMAAGEAVGCFGLTEPDSRFRPGRHADLRQADGSDWVLYGTKMWITNGSIADIAVVWARTEDGIRGFLVPRGTPGFTRQDIHQKLSLRASVTSELVLETSGSRRTPCCPASPGCAGRCRA